MPDGGDSAIEFRRRVAAGEAIFHQGDVGECAYIIQSGEVEIRADDRILARRAAGEIVGEMAVVDRLPRSADAVAVTDCELLPVTEDHLRRRLDSLDAVTRMIMGVILRRFRETVGGAAAPAPCPATGPDSHSAAIAHIELEQEIGHGLKHGEFAMVYQPIMAARTGAVAGYEALARWNHPERGRLGPGAFIPHIEATGMLGAFTRWALEQVCADAVQLTAPGVAPPFVAVNVGAADICEPGFPERVRAALSAAGVAPGRLTVEITETGLMESPGAAIEAMSACRAIGATIAIDDFGAGYSNLGYLSRYPAQKLKIDKSFIDALVDADAASARDLVSAIIKIAEVMGMETVAEGVETAEQAAAAARLGCDYLQGYHFARPLPLDAAIAHLAAHGAP